ncbi:ankyrin repeat domain-containing protein [Actimicrobium antarcticum]
MLARRLAVEAKFEVARNFDAQRTALQGKSYSPYFTNHFKDVLRQCDQYGVDHRLPLNQTPLMVAAIAGNIALVEALLERGADREAVDHYGWNALHWAMREAFRDEAFARGPFALLYELLAPSALDVSAADRLVRLDRHMAEYFLFQTMWVLFSSRFTHFQDRPHGAFDTAAILDVWQYLPPNVVWPERNLRRHISHILSRNEVARDYAYNRALFVRVQQGWYQFNPGLRVRRSVQGNETWVPVFEALNLGLTAEFALDFMVSRAAGFLERAGLPAPVAPIGADRAR